MAENTSTTAAAGVQETQTAGAPEITTTQPEERKFSQAELDDVVEKRLARERKKFPSQEELTAFRAWQETQQTEQQKQQRILNERNTFEARVTELEAQIEQARRERLLISKGVAADDVDYYVFKIGKLTTDSTDFDKAAETYLKEHAPSVPAAQTAPTVRASFGAQMGAGGEVGPVEKFIAFARRGAGLK